MTVQAPPDTPVQAPAGTPTHDSNKGRRRWSWILTVGALLAGAAVAAFVFAGSGSEEEYAYELNGDLNETGGGAVARQTGGTLTAEGLAFERGEGITLDVELGEDYEIAARLRLDTGADPQYFNFVKLFDLQDRTVEAGLYVYNESSLVFFFSRGCSGTVETAQGCPGSGTRKALISPPNSFPMGSFTTVRLVRSGNDVEAYIDDELQTWLVFPGAGSPSEGLDSFTDFGDEFVQGGRVVIDPETRERRAGTPVLHVLLDDFATGGVEAGTGELDYVRITTS